MDRVRYIANLMASGQYRTRLTEQELCARWGISSCVYRQHAAEASRWLKLDPAEIEDLRTRNVMTLERLVHDALERKNTMTGLPDYRSVNDAIRLMQEMLGPNEDKSRDPEEMTDDELRELAKKATALLLAPSAVGKNERKEDGEGSPS